MIGRYHHRASFVVARNQVEVFEMTVVYLVSDSGLAEALNGLEMLDRRRVVVAVSEADSDRILSFADSPIWDTRSGQTNGASGAAFDSPSK